MEVSIPLISGGSITVILPCYLRELTKRNAFRVRNLNRIYEFIKQLRTNRSHGLNEMKTKSIDENFIKMATYYREDR